MSRLVMMVVMLLVTVNVYAGSTVTEYGNIAYYSDDSGNTGTATTYGNTTYYNSSSGLSSACTQYGNQTYCN